MNLYIISTNCPSDRMIGCNSSRSQVRNCICLKLLFKGEDRAQKHPALFSQEMRLALAMRFQQKNVKIIDFWLTSQILSFSWDHTWTSKFKFRSPWVTQTQMWIVEGRVAPLGQPLGQNNHFQYHFKNIVAEEDKGYLSDSQPPKFSIHSHLTQISTKSHPQ